MSTSFYSFGSSATVMAPVDFLRLRYEDEQLTKAFRGRVTLRPVHGMPSNQWPSWGVNFTVAGYNVIGRFTPEHPLRPPRFTILPEPQNRHYYADTRGPHLCYVKPEEWSPRYTMATAVAVVLRFINDYRNRKAD